MNLIYRDLKPENVLVNYDGYLKLSDFGFLKKIKPNERTYTLCGTPEYLAPEVIQNKGHGKAVDWYCLGIFLYELTIGKCPFMHDDPYQVFEMILTEKIKFPKIYDEGCKSLIKKLTCHDLSKRYGNLKDGALDVKKHRFFKDIDFGKLLNKQVSKVPYKPGSEGLNSKHTGLVTGLSHKDISENKDNIRSPPICRAEDIFQDWFCKE